MALGVVGVGGFSCIDVVIVGFFCAWEVVGGACGEFVEGGFLFWECVVFDEDVVFVVGEGVFGKKGAIFGSGNAGW